MIFLFLYLLAKGAVPSALSNVSSTLLTNMSVLFIPAGVGVMAHTTLLKTDFWPIMIAMVVSTLVTIIVTALVMKKLNKTSPPDGAPQPND
jgi:holin-like protein